MKLDEAKQKFIQSWGTLGSSWGINRTMAQIHALLMIAPDPLSAEEVMEGLSISRGNANMNLRALIDWQLVYKELKPGERKEYFVAEKDVWEIAKRVMEGRKKREIEPVIRVLGEIKEVEEDPSNPEVEAFTKTIEDLESLVVQMDNLSDRLLKADENWFFSKFLKLLK